MQKRPPIAPPLQNNASVDSWTIVYSMSKKSKAPPQHKQRPKGPGGEQPARKRPKRDTKQAAAASELAASMAQRCGRDDCRVCTPKACNKCARCKASPKPTAGKCNEAQKLRRQTCPNMAPAPRDDGVDPRKLDKKGPYFRASTEITGVMDALANSTQLAAPDLYALACFKNSLDQSGRLDARWVSLDKIKARDDYDIDDINANQEAAIEAVVREMHFKDGSKPSAEEMARMGPLEMLTVVRVLSHTAPMNYRTKAQIKARPPALGASLSDQARDTFVAFVEGRKYDGVHVCMSLARKKDEPWLKYWQRCLDLLCENRNELRGGRKKFYYLLQCLRNGAVQWACTPKMRAWFVERECQYQNIMACRRPVTGDFHIGIPELMPPRDEATAEELAMIGDFFRDDGKLWRVDDVYFEEKAYKCPLTGVDKGALVVLHHDVGEHGIECPDGVTLPEMPLDEFMGEFKKRRGAKWVKAPEAS